MLADKQARVVEAQPFDFDSDGDLDVLVAEFGYLESGAFKLLRNVGGNDENPQMKVEILDSRHGALGVRIADMNGDGKDDFVVSYGQEHESVEVHFAESPGVFRRQVVLELPDPSYNSSSFEIADIDADGRLDIVHTNGDTLDTYLPKPYHGVRILRNVGDGQFANIELGLLVGALQSAVGDFDGDGDLDIAAVGLFPLAAEDGPGAYDAICWWEQREGLQFIRHAVQRDQCDYVTCVALDSNGDGNLELVLGNWGAAPGEDVFRRVAFIPK